MSDEEEHSDELEFQTETNYETIYDFKLGRNDFETISNYVKRFDRNERRKTELRTKETVRQEEVETFVKEQKRENTTKKTVSDMKTFQRYLSSNCDENKDIFRSKGALVHLI